MIKLINWTHAIKLNIVITKWVTDIKMWDTPLCHKLDSCRKRKAFSCLTKPVSDTVSSWWRWRQRGDCYWVDSRVNSASELWVWLRIPDLDSRLVNTVYPVTVHWTHRAVFVGDGRDKLTQKSKLAVYTVMCYYSNRHHWPHSLLTTQFPGNYLPQTTAAGQTVPSANPGWANHINLLILGILEFL